jgi:hypothetical protein
MMRRLGTSSRVRKVCVFSQSAFDRPPCASGLPASREEFLRTKQPFGDPLVDRDLDLRGVTDGLRRVKDGTRQCRHAKAAHVRHVREWKRLFRRMDADAVSGDVAFFARHEELPAFGDDVGAGMHEERRDM